MKALQLVQNLRKNGIEDALPGKVMYNDIVMPDHYDIRMSREGDEYILLYREGFDLDDCNREIMEQVAQLSLELFRGLFDDTTVDLPKIEIEDDVMWVTYTRRDKEPSAFFTSVICELSPFCPALPMGFKEKLYERVDMNMKAALLQRCGDFMAGTGADERDPLGLIEKEDEAGEKSADLEPDECEKGQIPSESESTK